MRTPRHSVARVLLALWVAGLMPLDPASAAGSQMRRADVGSRPVLLADAVRRDRAGPRVDRRASARRNPARIQRRPGAQRRDAGTRERARRRETDSRAIELRRHRRRARSYLSRSALQHRGAAIAPGLGADHRARLRTRLRGLPRSERRALRARLAHFRTLPAAERQTLRRSHAHLRSLPAAERDEVLANAKRWSSLDEDQHRRLKSVWDRFSRMPLEEQELALDRALSH